MYTMMLKYSAFFELYAIGLKMTILGWNMLPIWYTLVVFDGSWILQYSNKHDGMINIKISSRIFLFHFSFVNS
jgi:hypothetical protein